MKSLVAPFNIVGGKVASTTDVDTIVRQKITNVLTTSSGERSGQESYGVGVQSLLFEPVDELVSADFKLDASMDLQQYITGVTIVDMVVEQYQYEESAVAITVYYKTPLSQVRSTTVNIARYPLHEESPI